MIESLHFIRPLWLLGLLPLVLYILWYIFLQGHSKNQNSFIDKNLAQFVLSNASSEDKFKWLKATSILLAGFISLIALSGPSWKKLPQPVIKQEDVMVLLLDLSASMNSKDISPSRLIRAKQKIADILDKRQDKQTALIAYAADAYIVTPITDDIKTIATHLPNLNSNTISKQGSRIDRAVIKANDLLTQTNIRQGHIIAITDGLELNNNIRQAIKTLANNGHYLSILGIATTAGGPIPKNGGGFITDKNNNIVLSKLDRGTLRQVAKLGNGSYTDISINDNDIISLTRQNKIPIKNRSTDKISDQWKDMGAYLSILLIPLLLCCFRRGIFFVLPLCILSISEPGNAETSFSWKNLFLNQEQQAYQLFKDKKYTEAAEKFSSAEWQASSQYKANQYKESLHNWDTNSSDGLYNQGNAQVQQGKLTAAIKSYQESLKINPDNEDAQYNLELVKQALQNQQNQQSQGKQGEQNQNTPEQNTGQSNTQNQNGQKQDSQNQQDNSSTQQQASQNDSTDQTNQSETEQKSKDQAKQAFEQALKESKANNDDKNKSSSAKQQLSKEELAKQEQLILQKQWLDRIQDDPSGLLRRKFEYQDYINKQQQEPKPW